MARRIDRNVGLRAGSSALARNDWKRVETAKDTGVMPMQRFARETHLWEGLEKHFQHDSDLHASEACAKAKMRA